MLVIQKNTQKPLYQNIDFDIDDENRNFSFESALFDLEINSIYYDAEHLAIESYIDYNGNESELQYQFKVIQESANQSLWEKIKSWLSKAWNWIKSLVIKFKNWILSFFSKQKAFISEFKDDERVVTVNIIEFGKAYATIDEFSKESIVMTEKIKAFYNNLVNGKSVPFIKEGASSFNYIMDNDSLFGISHEYTSIESIPNYIKEKVYNNKKKISIKLKDFVSKLQDFIKIKDNVNSKTMDKKITKMALSIQAFFSAGSTETKNGVFVENKTLLTITKDATMMCLKIISGYMKVIKDVISDNIDAVRRAIK